MHSVPLFIIQRFTALECFLSTSTSIHVTSVIEVTFHVARPDRASPGRQQAVHVLHTVKHASTMSAITELEDSLDMLLKVMASAIAYLSRKAAHTQVNPTVPLTTLGNTDAPSFEALQGTRAELVQDIVSQAQDVQLRISHLPTTMLSEDEHVRMADLPRKACEICALETELQEANREYIQSLDEARMYILLTHNRSTIFEARCPT